MRLAVFCIDKRSFSANLFFYGENCKLSRNDATKYGLVNDMRFPTLKVGVLSFVSEIGTRSNSYRAAIMVILQRY